MSGRGEGERGSGTVLVLALVAVVLALLMVLAAVTQVVRERHRAAAGADLAALAGAGALAQGRSDACQVAAATARANDGRLSSCRVVGADVVVRVDTVARPALWFPVGALVPSAWARAGPQR